MNATTGVFTISTTGTYLFTFQAFSQLSHGGLALTVNSNFVIQSYGATYGSIVGTDIQRLYKGDRVEVKTRHDLSTSDNSILNQFTGTLLTTTF